MLIELAYKADKNYTSVSYRQIYCTKLIIIVKLWIQVKRLTWRARPSIVILIFTDVENSVIENNIAFKIPELRDFIYCAFT
jgi:hypothetical protein